MTATLETGEVREKTLVQPKWQQPERPPKYDEVVSKFRSLTVRTLGQGEGSKIIEYLSGPLDTPAMDFLNVLFAR